MSATKRTIARRHGAFVNHSGWNASGDPEWRMRKTMSKSERDEFDARTPEDKRLIVEQWCLTIACAGTSS